ncbi:MAG: HU family DNA-binding protein [Thiotrichales bacterium]|nr:HU family DNA-binding protein [Thiotrichales bacterium]
MAKVTAVKQPMTKAQLLSAIAEDTGLTRKQVTEVMDSLSGQIQRHIKKRGPGTFTLPGLLKVKTVRKPARRARKGVNPFTGEETTFAAKPAHTVVKIQPLKGLKDMVA